MVMIPEKKYPTPPAHAMVSHTQKGMAPIMCSTNHANMTRPVTLVMRVDNDSDDLLDPKYHH